MEPPVTSPEWVVLELSPQGEDEDPDVLRKVLARVIRGGEVFIPASVSIVGDSRSVHKLIDNYIFVRRTFPDSFFLKLEGTRYIASCLTVANTANGSRKLACVRENDIDKMKRQINVETEQGIEVNDEVEVMSGAYKGINGRVIEDIPETQSVQVYIKLRSKEAIITLPRSFLRFVGKDKADADEMPTFAPFATKVARIREWAEKVSPLFKWEPSSVIKIREAHQTYLRIKAWMGAGFKLIEELKPPPDITPVQEKFEAFQSVDRLFQRAPMFFVLPKVEVPSPTPLESKILEVQWFEDVVHRLAALQQDVEAIERCIPEWSPEMVKNILIDGHNMAFRVAHGVKVAMTDKEGNPTTLIYGFLRSVGALRKRFPAAKIHVVWDGSRQRRVTKCADYKAQRPSSTGVVSSQMERLREILPLLGVVQAFNPEEETDDVIACLVKGPLKGQSNVIVSTDRDFLQLVTYSDIVLVPKVGPRAEILYDPDRVVAEYGIAPSKIVHLRALLGDTSDNLKGVERIPQKVLAGLLNAHGSLDGIFASNLAGVTSSQYEKLRAFEAQAKLNFEMMTLIDDLSYSVVEPGPDRVAASEVLVQCDIKPESILDAFFGKDSGGFTKTS